MYEEEADGPRLDGNGMAGWDQAIYDKRFMSLHGRVS